MTRRHWIGVVVLLALLLPWLVDVLVVTDEESLRGLLDDFALYAEEQDLDGIFGLLADDFQSEAPSFRERTSDQWRTRAARFFEPVQEVRVDLEKVELFVDGDEARSVVNGFLMLRTAEGGIPWQVEAELLWRRQPEGWRIARLRSLNARIGAF